MRGEGGVGNTVGTLVKEGIRSQSTQKLLM